MFEPDVALTDFAIALACGVFAFALARRRPGPTRRAFIGLFAFTGAAALVGGIAHGFFDIDSGTNAVGLLWLATMAFIGGAGAASWLIVATLLLPASRHGFARRVIAGEWLAYLAWVIWVDSSFVTAIVQYTVPALALLGTLVFIYARRRDTSVLIGVGALALTFLAGALQQAGYSPIAALTHNAFFHVLQLLALVGLFVTARHIDEVR